MTTFQDARAFLLKLVGFPAPAFFLHLRIARALDLLCALRAVLYVTEANWDVVPELLLTGD